jgi:hypothetical protein
MTQKHTDQRPGRLQDPASGGERRPGLRAAGVAAASVVRPITARGGGILAQLKAAWTAIAGGEFATIAWPEALGRDGALRLRVESAAALELQHRAPLVIEHINRFFGRGAVTRLVIVQGRPPGAPARRAPAHAPLSAGETESLAMQLDKIADPDLRTALDGLGRLVLRRSRE